MQTCEHHSDAVVVYLGYDCPLCKLEDDLKAELRRGDRLEIELDDVKSELEELKNAKSQSGN